MAKKKKDRTGRVILISKEDNILLKQYFLYGESKGVTLSNSEICDNIFRTGLYEITKEMTNGNNN